VVGILLSSNVFSFAVVGWQATFGKGLDFEIKILPWTAVEVYHDWVLISPPPVTSSPPVKRPGAAAVGPIKNEAHQPPLRNITASGPGSTRKKIVGTGRVAERAVGPHNPGLPASSLLRANLTPRMSLLVKQLERSVRKQLKQLNLFYAAHISLLYL
jgi:hypothetical protein